MAVLLKCMYCRQFAPTNPCLVCQLRIATSELQEVGVLLKRAEKSLKWMVEDMKWRADETKQNTEEGSHGDYSPKLKEAMDLLKELENE